VPKVKLLILFVCHSEMLWGSLLLVALLMVWEKCFLFQEFKVKMLLNSTTWLFFPCNSENCYFAVSPKTVSLRPMKRLLRYSVTPITGYPPQVQALPSSFSYMKPSATRTCDPTERDFFKESFPLHVACAETGL